MENLLKKSSPALLVLFFSLFLRLAADAQAPGLAAGSLNTCATSPLFAAAKGYKNPVFSTVDRFLPGIVMTSASMPTAPQFQHPSWKKFGKLGPFVVDGSGAIFIAPVPNINTLQNPPEAQNTIYRLDPESAELTPFITIPVETIPSQKNPYGILGLGYDCESRILYAATVSGSSAEVETGKIVSIDTYRHKIIATLSGIDAIGLGVFRENGGRKYLYIGSAREPIIKKVALGKDGTFSGSPTTLFTFENILDIRARKISFKGKDMLIQATEFRYNLIAQSEYLQPQYSYRFSPENSSWNFLGKSQNPADEIVLVQAP